MATQFARRLLRRFAARLLGPLNRLAYRDFYRFPFGSAPKASADTYRQLWTDAKAATYSAVDEYERETGHAIDDDWLHDLALLTQVVIKSSDICYQHGRLLYSALSAYVRRHTPPSVTILETGTARGFSCLCMAKALSDMQQAGKIVTFDVLPHDVRMFWNCIADEDGPKTRAELLGDYTPLLERYVLFHQGDTKLELKKIGMPRVHFAFLDGMHTYDYVMHEGAFVHERQETGDVVFFDDYSPDQFPGVVKAADEICSKYGYSKRVISLGPQRAYVIATKE